MAIYNGFTHWKWWFFYSFLLVYQRVVLSTIQRLGQVVAGNKFKVSGGWPAVGLALFLPTSHRSGGLKAVGRGEIPHCFECYDRTW